MKSNFKNTIILIGILSALVTFLLIIRFLK